MIQVFFFKLVFRQLYEGNKCNIMTLSCPLKDMVSPQAVTAYKWIRTSSGEEENVHGVIEFVGFIELLGFVGLIEFIEFVVLGATVDIIEAFDIIFFDIIAVLNFNDLKKLFRRVLKAVLRVDGNIGAFIVLNQVCFTFSRNLSHS